MEKIKIGRKFVGIEQPPYFIADIGANHDGNIERAFKLIELAKEAGADAAKFQNFKAPTIVSRKGFDEIGSQLSHQKNWKKSVYEIYEDASVSDDWTVALKEKCDECEIEYFTSPYDFNSVDAVDPFVNMYKIGSGDITWHEIIQYIASKGKPVLIATGASSLEEVKMAMELLLRETLDIVLMQCNTNYTGSKENLKYLNLNVLKTYHDMYPKIVLGLSDHSHGHSSVLAAIALGARVIEKHFTDDNDREGPDHKFAMNPTSWGEMVAASTEVYDSLGDGIKKVEANETQTAVVQRRALRYTRNIKAGETILDGDIIAVRPIPKNGLPPYKKEELILKKLLMDVEEDSLAVREHFSYD
jgi:sialic acid synthase SpsE